MNKASRRELLAGMVAAGAVAGVDVNSFAQAAKTQPANGLKICIFSKHFQWTDCKEEEALSAEIGFDGVNLTVRDGGHVLPERVEQDLHKAVETVRQAGLSVGLGGADGGRPTLTIPKEQLVSIMRRDLKYVKGLMQEAPLL